MNKNLKKVISTVAALAVSASSLVAFAANFPDVADTASYSQAVTELTALGVINGYEDGTFGPDKNVTRAEITKMIVSALGSSQLSAANAATGKDTKFADVTGSHWASGFVTVGTSDSTKFIDGYSDTEFGPEDNVTYAQAIKMLVAALGYTTYAENNGGWPNGYLSYGYNLDITKGISGVANDTQVTRAQVAQMIDNAVKAPICVVDGYETQWNGTQTPKLVERNEPSTSSKNSWQCLLNYSHDAYIIYGRVTATHQSDDSVDTDKVKLAVEKSNNYGGYQVIAGYETNTTLDLTPNAYIGESGADKYLLTYSEMLVKADDDDDITILSITPVGADSKNVTFAAEDYNDDAKDSVYTSTNGRGTISVFESGSSTKTKEYKIDLESIEKNFYVNGYPVTVSDLKTAMDTYVTKNATGKVTLVDSPDAGKSSTDGIYDIIQISYYVDAVVSSVEGDDEDCTIYFDTASDALDGATEMDVDTTDDKMYYSFKMADGTAVKPTELKEYDVLSIAFTGNDFSKSSSFEVIVSRDTVEGKLSTVNKGDAEKDHEYTVGGKAYKVADESLVSNKDFTVGNEYTLYLDAFGKVARVDETSATKKIALLDNVYRANGDQYYATIIKPDGSKDSYVFDDKYKDTYYGYCFAGSTKFDDSDTKKAPQDRVFTYSISSSTEKITFKELQAYKECNDETYAAKSLKLGSIKLSESTTSILDLSSYATDKEFDVMDINSLEDDANYTAYGFNKSNSDSTYSFVLVTKGGQGSYSYNTKFVIFSASTQDDVDGDTKTAIKVYAPGSKEVTKYIIDDGTAEDEVAKLSEGAPIVVKKNSSGYVTEVTPLFKKSLSDYSAFSTAALDGLANNDLSAVVDKTALDKLMKLGSGKNASDWVFGAVYDKSNSDITIATTADFETVGGNKYVTNVDKIDSYDVDSDAVFYLYNYKERSGRELRVANGILSSARSVNANSTSAYVAGTAADGKTYTADDKVLLDWNSKTVRGGVDGTGYETSTKGKIQYVLAKTIDGDIVEAYFINPSNN